MRIFLGIGCLCALLAAAGTARAGEGGGEVEAVLEAEKKLDAAKAKTAELTAENQRLRRSAETLETAAQVTRDPASRPPPPERVVESLLENPLDDVKGFVGTKGKLELAEADGRKVFSLSAPGAECARGSVKVPENSTLLLSCWIKGEDVRATRKNGGTRVGAMVTGTDGQTQWPSAAALTGTFDWTQATCRLAIPPGCEKITLLLGLAGAEGKAQVRDLRIERLR